MPQIMVNERTRTVAPGTWLFALRDQLKPGADVLVRNGAPADEDCELAEGDAVVFIRRGEVLPPSELEALMVARHTPGVYARLKTAVVGIAGLGGLGSTVAVALARTGVGRMILADFDVVEPSNLNRQQYFIGQIGRFKTEALAENISQVNPCTRIDRHTVRLAPDNVARVFHEAQVLVEAFDGAEAKAMLVESFLGAYPDRHVVAASGMAGHGPGNDVRARRMGRGLVLVGDLTTGAAPGMGLMAPRVGIAACQQANAVLRILLGEDPVE
jgi:sulfur carrier protein ThiS adenylyltransferase